VQTRFLTWGLAAAALLWGCSRREAPVAAASPDPEPARASTRTPAAGAEPVAVVELFTSEGCSSCPPADENLRRIAAAADRSGRRVFALSFHVDYWNDLGWADPFSSAASSERQRRYARALGSGVYTPQMVVNGRLQLLGSDAQAADEAIGEALRERPAGRIDLSVERSEGSRRVVVGWRASGAAARTRLNVALVHDAERVDVTRGENHGHTLAHRNVVRAFASQIVESDHGSVSLALPADVEPAHAQVVTFTADPESQAVRAAARAGVP